MCRACNIEKYKTLCGDAKYKKRPAWIVIDAFF